MPSITVEGRCHLKIQKEKNKNAGFSSDQKVNFFCNNPNLDS